MRVWHWHLRVTEIVMLTGVFMLSAFHLLLAASAEIACLIRHCMTRDLHERQRWCMHV